MTKDCIKNDVLVPVFFNIPFQSSYTYNVNVVNVVGAVRRSGSKSTNLLLIENNLLLIALFFSNETSTSTLDGMLTMSSTFNLVSSISDVVSSTTSDEMSPSMTPTNGKLLFIRKYYKNKILCKNNYVLRSTKPH